MKFLPVFFIAVGLSLTGLFYGCAPSADETKVIILSTTDVHGHVYPWDYYADQPDEAHSLLKAVTMIRETRRDHPHTLVLDAGDWLQGNPFAEYFARVDTTAEYPLLQTMEGAGFDAIVIGNHEFNFGIEMLNRRIEETDAAFLGANIKHAHSGEPAYTPYIIKNFDDFRVAVIGLTTPGSAVWDRPRVEGRLTFEDGVEIAEKYVQIVQNKGADAVIILAHSGYEGSTSYTSDYIGEENFGRSIAGQVPGVHALVLGHTHRVMEDYISETEANPQGVAVIQPGRWASHLGHTELFLSRDDDGEVSVRFGRNEARPVADYEPDPQLSDMLMDRHEQVRDYINEPVAHTETEWSAGDARLYVRPVIDLIHHVQKKISGAQLSAASVFNPNTRLGPGGISRGDLAMLYPYENSLFKLRITGKQLREYLEFSARFFETTPEGSIPEPSGVTPGFNYDMISGVDYSLDFSRPVGSRVVSLQYDGRDVTDDDSFTIAINSYRAVGGGDFDMIAEAEVMEEFDQSIRKMIEDWLMEKEYIEPDDVTPSTWRILNLPEN